MMNVWFEGMGAKATARRSPHEAEKRLGGVSSSSTKERLNNFERYAHVFTELIHRDGMTLFLAKLCAHPAYDTPRLPGTFSCNPSDIFRINYDPVKYHW